MMDKILKILKKSTIIFGLAMLVLILVLVINHKELHPTFMIVAKNYLLISIIFAIIYLVYNKINKKWLRFIIIADINIVTVVILSL